MLKQQKKQKLPFKLYQHIKILKNLKHIVYGEY